MPSHTGNPEHIIAVANAQPRERDPITTATDPIKKLLDSWIDLDKVISMVDSLPANSYNRNTRMTLREIKARFEQPPNSASSPLICLNLDRNSMPNRVVQMNKDRNNDAEFKRCIKEDRRFLCRRLLAQSGATQTFDAVETDTWIAVEKGAVQIADGREDTPVILQLAVGSFAILFPRTYTFRYVGNTLISMGNIVARGVEK
jgi:hypothetical protein